MKARLIIADDHEVVRRGLCDIIARTHDMTVVAEAAEGTTAERLARQLPADLLVLDIGLPIKNGLQILEALRADRVLVPVLFFSLCPARQYANYAQRAGAQGFVSKDVDTAVLLTALRRVLTAGTSFASPGGEVKPTLPSNVFATLSPREIEVLHGLLHGVSLQNISLQMQVNSKTVGTYRTRLLAKLGVTSNMELAALATQHHFPQNIHAL